MVGCRAGTSREGRVRCAGQILSVDTSLWLVLLTATASLSIFSSCSFSCSLASPADKSSDSIKILLQIRAGDTAIVNQHNVAHFNRSVLPIVKSFTDCALAMEEKIKSVEENANKSVIWYLMADSASTRKYMSDTFGDKVFCTFCALPPCFFSPSSFQSDPEALS